MEVLAAGYWFEVDEFTPSPDETAEPVGDQLPIGSDPDGAADPAVVDPDFEIVSQMLTEEGQETKEEEKKLETKESQQKGGEIANESVSTVYTTNDVVNRLEGIQVQLGVVDVCLVVFLLLHLFRSFIRIPR